MNEDLKKFPEFSLGVCHGLVKAVLTDIDVFLLFLSALIPHKGLQRSLMLYVIARRADQYATLFAQVFRYPETPSP